MTNSSDERLARWDRSYGRRLKEERLRLGLTQHALAERCNITAASQFLYEKGARSPNGTYLVKAMTLGLKLSYIFKDDTADAAPDFTTRFLLYKQPGYLARDEQGQPLDLGELFAVFERLVFKHANLTKKNEDERPKEPPPRGNAI